MITKECILEAVRESIPVETILKAYLDETVEENVETMVTTVKEERKEVVEADTTADVRDVDAVAAPSTDVDAVAAPSTDVDVVAAPSTDVDVVASTKAAETVQSEDLSVGSVDPLTLATEPSQIGGGISLDIDETVSSPTVSTTTSTSPTKQLTFSNIDQALNEDKSVSNVLAPKDVTTLERISDENHIKRLMEEADDEDDEDRIKIMEDTDVNISLDVETL